MTGTPASSPQNALGAQVAEVIEEMDRANAARETALPACRRVIRAAGSSIRAVHRLEPETATKLADESENELRQAQRAVADFPNVANAGFLHDAEKEYVEARAVAALIAGEAVPGARELEVGGAAWMRGLAEAASELRRHLLDRLREGNLQRSQELLATMDTVYDALVVVDYPDALTGGLRRTLDQLRAVLERCRGDVTTAVVISTQQSQ